MSGWRLAERGRGWREADLVRLADPEAVARQPGAFILQRSKLNCVVAVTVEGRPVVLKLFDEVAWGRWLQCWILGSAARRAARSARRLSEAGFPAPEVVAVLEKRRVWACCKSCLVTTFVAGPTLEEMWRRLGQADRGRIAADLGGYVRALHRAGLYPQDLRAANLIADRRAPGWAFVLVDLDRVRSYRSLSARRKVKNLVQLHRSIGRLARPSEQLRFLRAYAGGDSKEDRTRVVAAVLAMSERKEREYQRRR